MPALNVCKEALDGKANVTHIDQLLSCIGMAEETMCINVIKIFLTKNTLNMQMGLHLHGFMQTVI